MERERQCDLLLAGGWVATVDDERRVFDPGAVAISGDRIVAVGSASDLSKYQAARTVDCAGKAVLPGFVDCHNHIFQALARGMGEGLPLYPWLAGFMWPYAAAIDEAQARAAARLMAVEALRAGITAVLDDHYAPNDADATLGVVRDIEAIGLRGVVGRGIFGPPTPAVKEYNLPDFLFARSAEEELDVTRACMEETRNAKVTVWPAPDGNFVDRDLVVAAVSLARELGAGWHTHCSEPQSDPAAYLRTYGERPVAWMHREGLLGRDATLAHMNWLDQDELSFVGETETGVAHNPASNGYLGSGVIRLRELREAGAVVGLGTDGCACSHRLDMFEQMKTMILIQRETHLESTVTTAHEAFELATREGAQYMGIDAGVLAPGKLADVAIVDLDRVHLTPWNGTIAELVYAGRPSDVWMTVVGGEVVYEGGRCLRVDEAEVRAEAQARSDELIARAGLSAFRRPWNGTVPPAAS